MIARPQKRLLSYGRRRRMGGYLVFRSAIADVEVIHHCGDLLDEGQPQKVLHIHFQTKRGSRLPRLGRSSVPVLEGGSQLIHPTVRGPAVYCEARFIYRCQCVKQ
jgi:hypothetical protein